MIETVVLEKQDLGSSLVQLGELRAEIFREYPYLYEADPILEKKYLQIYLKSQNSLIVVARDEGKSIGMISGISLLEAVQEAWTTPSSISKEGIFYLGEILIRKEFRGLGLGQTLYDQFENWVKEKKIYSKIAFKEVVLPTNDSRRPNDYFSLDSFWMKRGYVKHPELLQYVEWPEISGKKVMHTLVFWIKELINLS